MPLTVNDVIRHLKYDEGSADLDDLQSLLDVAEQAVKDHVLTKYDAENKAQQRAILLLCGYYDKYRNLEGEMPTNGFSCRNLYWSFLIHIMCHWRFNYG